MLSSTGQTYSGVRPQCRRYLLLKARCMPTANAEDLLRYHGASDHHLSDVALPPYLALGVCHRRAPKLCAKQIRAPTSKLSQCQDNSACLVDNPGWGEYDCAPHNGRPGVKQYCGHNYTRHAYTGHNHTGHNNIGHNYTGHNFIGIATRPSGQSPWRAVHAHAASARLTPRRVSRLRAWRAHRSAKRSMATHSATDARTPPPLLVQPDQHDLRQHYLGQHYFNKRLQRSFGAT